MNISMHIYTVYICISGFFGCENVDMNQTLPQEKLPQQKQHVVFSFISSLFRISAKHCGAKPNPWLSVSGAKRIWRLKRTRHPEGVQSGVVCRVDHLIPWICVAMMLGKSEVKTFSQSDESHGKT